MRKHISSLCDGLARGARGAAQGIQSLAGRPEARRFVVTLAMVAGMSLLFTATALAGPGTNSLGGSNSVEDTILSAAQEIYLKWRMPASLVMLMVAAYYQFWSSDPRGKQYAKAVVGGVVFFALIPTLYDMLMGFTGTN